MRNWSGSVEFTPSRCETPYDVGELVRIIERARETGGTVRPRGSGHSSVPLIATHDVSVSLQNMSGLIDHDPRSGNATLGPGTSLHAAGDELAAVDLAMENLGDVDYQALAGAIATGTHGTGLCYGNLSSTLVGGTMVTGAGEIVRFGIDDPDDDGELRRAVGVSLGAIGVLTSMTIRTTAEYELRRVDWFTDAAWAIDHFLELSLANRNADIYWYPRSDEVKVRTLNLLDHEPSVMPEHARIAADETGPSHGIIPQSRHQKFEEMEYIFPLEVGMDVFRAVRERIRKRHRRDIAWRVLVRTIARDDMMISNCNGHDNMSIALLNNNTLPFQPYFDDMEPLLLDYGGRPHWGKKHSRKASRLREMYPEWDRFQELRRAHDPDGVLLNPYLRELFEADEEGA